MAEPPAGIAVVDEPGAPEYESPVRKSSHPFADYEADIRDRLRADSTFAARAEGVMDYRKVVIRSRADGLEIPAHVFLPLAPRPGMPALIWVHGGLHAHLSPYPYWPFIREAVERGYAVVAPDYRGSTGYGEAFHRAIDYGGFEVDDVLAAYDWIVAHLPLVDPGRVGVIGWSHGGLIALLAAARADNPFRAVAAIAPVSNLIFRLAYKGPAYQEYFTSQERIGGLPHQVPETYVARSPVYQVDRLDVPALVHVATNDEDVDFVESEMLINALRVKKPGLAETVVYRDPPGGHMFSRLVDPLALERRDTPEQRDSWNRTWSFFEWHLRPYDGR